MVSEVGSGVWAIGGFRAKSRVQPSIAASVWALLLFLTWALPARADDLVWQLGIFDYSSAEFSPSEAPRLPQYTVGDAKPTGPWGALQPVGVAATRTVAFSLLSIILPSEF